jgi:hypothetical protein
MTEIIKQELPNGASSEKQKSIEDHKKIATQLMQAAELHFAAANYIEMDDHVQAFDNIVKAYSLLSLARESQQINLDHTLNGQIMF